ncbi:MAG: branched-chain amino acid ABC transporter ATP-binding protein/permease [Phormidesmis sp.]
MSRLIFGLGLLAIAIIATLLAPNTYYLFLLGMVAITTIVGVGLNILVGLSGQVSIGHAGFFAIGAYAGVIAMTGAGWNFWFALGVGVIAAAVTGAALAAPALRVTGPYLAMITIAFGIIVERVLIEWVGLTGGFGGISNIPQPTLFGLQPAMRDVVLVVILIAFGSLLFFAGLKQNAWGKAFQAVRDDEIAATAVGLNTLVVRVVAFTLSAGFTGLAGVFFAAAVGFISPDSFTFHRSILFLLVAIVGGLGSVEGALIGAVVLVLLPEFLHDFAEYQLLVFGGLLLLTLWLAPDGVMSLLGRLSNRLPGRFANLSSEGRPPLKPLATPPAHIPALAVRRQRPDSLTVEQVGIQFGGIRAVDQVDLTATAGHITAVIGPNGAGKTTLLNLISGFYQSQTGQIMLGQTDLTQLSSLQIARRGITRTFQATRLFSSLSVLDNLRLAQTGGQLGSVLGALTGGLRSRQSYKPLLELLAFVGYGGDGHQLAGSLPFVDRRLVEIARALATGPEVLLLDEPAAGLGKEDKARLADLIRRIAHAGLKVILIEHDMDLVMGISDQVVVLDSGQRICTGSPTQVQQNPAVLEAYLGVSDANLSRPALPDPAPLLQIQQLVTGYDRLRVLHKISLTVNQGELVAVIGANGTGKSTLLKTISGLLPVWSGQMHFDGKELYGIASHQMAALGIVLVPEGRQVFTELSVQDNLRLGAFHRRDSKIEADIQSVLDRFPHLRQLQEQRAGLLSGGEQQMLAIARGLMARPKVLLLDEPSMGLAPKLVASLYKTLAGLRDEGMTILLVDQMATLALSVADHAYLLEAGEIVRSGNAKAMRRDPEIAQAYLGR